MKYFDVQITDYKGTTHEYYADETEAKGRTYIINQSSLTVSASYEENDLQDLLDELSEIKEMLVKLQSWTHYQDEE